MDEIVPVLIAIGLLFTVITLVGHGIWVLLAAVFRGSRETPDPSRVPCVHCGRPTSRTASRCDWCGAMSSRVSAEVADLDAVERQLRRFRESGAMEPEEVERLLSRVREYRRQLLAPPPPLVTERPASDIITPQVVEEPVVRTPVATPKPAAPRPRPVERPVERPVVEQLTPTVDRPAPRSQPVMPVEPPAPPAIPERNWTELLAGFLEERNIRWAELVGVLVGGLLIVGASLALVVSFWDTLQETYLKFWVFVGYSSAVFGAGLFVFHRWKLVSTGRGLLAIATLLVPLNFVAMASLSPGEWTLPTAATELLSLAIFAWLVALASDVLVGGRFWPMTLAVLGNSAVVLLAARLFGQDSSEWVMLIANGVPAGLLLAAVVGQSRGWASRRIEAGDAASRFTLLGVATFAGAVAIGILMTKACKSLDPRTAMYCLAPSLALAAWPILASGLRIMRGMARVGDQPDESLEAFRTAGTIVGLVGVMLQLVALGLCWPQPLGLLIVGTINAAGLVFAAFRYRFPIAHAGAMVCIAVAYAAGFHLLTDPGLRALQSGALVIHDAGLNAIMLQRMFSARTATSLCGLFLLFGAIATWFASRGWSRHAAAYVLGCGVTAVVALLSVTSLTLAGSYADALHAAWIFAFYGVACVLISMRWRRTTFIDTQVRNVGGCRPNTPVHRPPVGRPGDIGFLTLNSYVGWNLLAAAPFWTLHTPLFATAAGSAATAGCLFWLAAVWLLLAWLHRNAGLIRAQQCVLTAASLALATAWLQTRAWVTDLPDDLLLDPRSLQTYGIALGILSLVWIVTRIALQKVPHEAAVRLRQLWNVEEPGVDWGVRHLVLWLQAALAAVCVMPEVLRELCSAMFGAEVADVSALWNAAGGPAAWILVGVLAAAWIAALWERWGRAELVGSLLLVATVPCLVAEQFVDSVAVGSALRWAMAACFVVSSVGLWCRSPLLAWCRRIGANVALTADGPRIARTTLLAVTAAPVVGLTAIAALLRIASVTPGGPAAGSFFEWMGPNLSYLVPLALVIAGLVGCALRESSAGYAFAAGMVAEMAVVLGYALHVAMDPDPARTFGVPELVTLIQLASITAAVWGMAWLAVRSRLDVWRESSHTEASALSQTLMDAQLGMSWFGNGILLVAALAVLALFQPEMAAWPTAVGMPLGWIALALAVAAVVYRNAQNGVRPSFDAIGALGMAVVGLAACTVRGWTLSDGSPIDPNWAYRVLLLGWAGYALLITLAAWIADDRRDDGGQLVSAVERWAGLAGVAAVALALKAAFWHTGIEERLWAAAAIAVASMAGALMAIYRRREGWALCAAIGVNLAASLIVWYVEETRNLTLDQWWIRLVQANAIASAVVAIVWTAIRRRFFLSDERPLQNSPCLSLQLTLPTLANAALLILPVAWLVQHPGGLPDWASELADAPGWLALLLTAVGMAWYVWQTIPDRLTHVLGGALLGVGVLVACGVTHAGSPWIAGWLEYHLLTTLWAAAALCVLGVGFVGRELREFPPPLVSRWVTFLGTLAIALALIHSPADRLGVWWSIRAIGTMGIAATIVALWRRSPLHVYLSGLSAVAIGYWAWLAWGNPNDVRQLICFGTIGLSAASAVWTVLQFVAPLGIPPWRYQPASLDTLHAATGLSGGAENAVDRSDRSIGRSGPASPLAWQERNVVFAHLAAAVALAAMVGLAGLGLLFELQSVGHAAVTRLAWIALGSVAASIGLTLWDRSARLTLCGLYITGLTGLVMSWDCWTGSRPVPLAICWQAASELAAWLLAAAVVGWLLKRTKDFWSVLAVYSEPNRWPSGWFAVLQTMLTAAASALVVWVSIDFTFDGVGNGVGLLGLSGRLAGVAGAAMLLASSIVMTRASEESRRAGWRYAALLAGLLLCGCTGWALLDPMVDPSVAECPWLHRAVVLLVAGAAMIFVSAFGLAKALPNASDWIAAGRRAALWFGGVTLASLGFVLVGEIASLDLDVGVPMASWAIAIVAGTLAFLIVACIRLAVSREADPFGLSQSGRQVYVYAAEAILVLVGLHLRLTLPWLFRLGIVERYWMFIVMAVAFAGAGLSEFFHRRRLPVLSKPLERTALLLPLLPAVGFWFAPDPASTWGVIGRTPMLWFLMSVFYGSLAFMRRSAGCAALAVLVGNMGLWVALDQCGIRLDQHPQLWLIPIALAVLVAEFLNHNRLSAAQSAALRYLALSVIYLSSTADMFIAGLGKDWRLPLALMLLSVAGVLGGLLLRVRSFLLLGIVFLLLDIVAMIWHAAVDLQHTWIWYVCAIVVGVAVLALVGLFEKRRNDLVEAVRKLKQWER